VSFKKTGNLFIISAPSGAGKTTLVEALLKEKHEHFSLSRVVTYTSRPMRSSEIHGRDYHFVSQEEFQNLIEQDHFLEWSTAYGAFYGFPHSILNEMVNGSSFIVIVDRAGARSLKHHVPSAVMIWICPPDLRTLEERLLARNTDSREAVTKRLELAAREMEFEQENPLFEYHIVNVLFNSSLNQIKSIIFTSLKTLI